MKRPTDDARGRARGQLALPLEAERRLGIDTLAALHREATGRRRAAAGGNGREPTHPGVTPHGDGAGPTGPEPEADRAAAGDGQGSNAPEGAHEENASE